MFDLDLVQVEPLTGQHDLSKFRCSKQPVQSFCRDKLHDAHASYRLRASVATHNGDPRIVGYYYLCLSSIAPEDVDRRLEGEFLHVDAVPVVYLGMIGVFSPLERKGIGRKLMADALWRTGEIAAHAGTYALVLDAMDQEAAAYYEEKFDFLRFQPGGLKMFLEIETILQALRG